jgi:hypothetical protein
MEVSPLQKQPNTRRPNRRLSMKSTFRLSMGIGLFGSVITLGLFAYEIYGIRKCHALIVESRLHTEPDKTASSGSRPGT